MQNANKLFNDEPTSIFRFSSLQSKDQEQQAVQDNINFLASMATASTPVTPIDSNINLQRQMRAAILPQPTLAKNNSMNIHELRQNLNEFCYKGFDELNALIQEQRWVRKIHFSIEYFVFFLYFIYLGTKLC